MRRDEILLPKQYMALPVEWLAAKRKKMNPVDKLVLMILVNRLGEDHATCWPGPASIAKDTGTSIDGVKGSLRRLKLAGIIRAVGIHEETDTTVWEVSSPGKEFTPRGDGIPGVTEYPGVNVPTGTEGGDRIPGGGVTEYPTRGDRIPGGGVTEYPTRGDRIPGGGVMEYSLITEGESLKESQKTSTEGVAAVAAISPPMDFPTKAGETPSPNASEVSAIQVPGQARTQPPVSTALNVPTQGAPLTPTHSVPALSVQTRSAPALTPTAPPAPVANACRSAVDMMARLRASGHDWLAVLPVQPETWTCGQWCAWCWSVASEVREGRGVALAMPDAHRLGKAMVACLAKYPDRRGLWTSLRDAVRVTPDESAVEALAAREIISVNF